jgi:hypothetical protein
MATVNKDFRVKNGLVVEGATGTIDGEDIITTGSTTDNLNEGTTNQYYTEGRAKTDAAELLTGATLTNITITGDGDGLTITAENGIADSTTDDLVEGTTNLYHTNDRVKNVIDDAISNGTQTNITVTYDSETNTLSFDAENGVDDSTTDDLDEGTVNLYFTDQRAVDAVINGQVDTDDIEEGTTNLYYTDVRVKNVIGDAVINGTQSNISVTYDDATNTLSFAAENGVDDSTTDDLDEGTNNLYFTDQRAVDAVVSGDVDTDDIEEGATNLYFTDQRAVDAVISGEVDTDDIEEGASNLYYTDTRVRDALEGGEGIIYTAATGEIAVDTDEIATKVYVDEVAQGLKVRGSVEAATTEDLGGTYANGTSGVDATLTLAASATLDIDGWTSWSQFDGILVKDQTDAEENGRYFVFVVGDAETAWVLKRCIDCDTAEEIPGSFVFVQHGTVYGSTGWVATVANSDTFAVGTDDIDWIQFSGAGTYIGGTGVEIEGTEISIDFTEFDTDDIDEGSTNLYYTDQRVDDYINASIDTDDVSEGEANLYFTDERAVDALEAVVPSFEAVDVNSIALNFAVTGTLSFDGSEILLFDSTAYRSAKLLVKISAGSHTYVSEILLTLDSSDNIAVTEYAMVNTGGLAPNIFPTMFGDDLYFIVDSINGNIKIFGTLIS